MDRMLLLLLCGGLATALAPPNAAHSDGRLRTKCRCRAQDGACWPEQADWEQLNASLSGALIGVPDELESCLRKG